MINRKIFVPFCCQFKIKKTHNVVEKKEERENKGNHLFIELDIFS